MTGSIVDYLNGQGQASDFATRKRLAEQNGITGYTGTAQQNTSLLSTLSSALPKAPVGNFASSTLPAGTEYGVGGRTEIRTDLGLTPAQIEAQRAENVRVAGEAGSFGVPASEYGNYQQDPSYRIPTLSDEEGKTFAAQNGLKGLQDNAYAGLTRTEAQAKANKIKQSYLDNSNPNTSFSYNPETIAGAKKSIASFRTRLQEITNNSWNHPNTIKDKTAGVIAGTANELGKLFNTAEDFNATYNSSPDFKAAVDSYTASGGDMQSILSNINGNKNNQTTSEYLSTPDGLSAPAQAAFQDLIPERQLAQQEIARIANVPQEYHDLYFGTPEKTGILEQKRVQAEEARRIIQQKAENEKANVQAQASLAIDRNQADYELQKAKIEENRMASRNYMTGMLAKLGALNTTGKAPEILATLEQNYNRDSNQLARETDIAHRTVENSLINTVHNIETSRDESILSVQSDLTKTGEDVTKEINKLQQASDKQIYSITDKAANELRVQTAKYTKEATALAQKNAKAYLKSVKKFSPGQVGSNYTKVNIRDLNIAGLGGNTTSVKNYFLKTDPAFQKEWSREVQNGNNANPTIQNITNSYNQWKSQNTKTKKGSTTKASDI